MGAKIKYKVQVGDKFKTTCGTEVQVIEVRSSNSVRVSDTLGNSKLCTSYNLRNNKVFWSKNGSFVKDKLKTRKPRVHKISIGDIYKTMFYGDIEVMFIEEDYSCDIKFLNTGYEIKGVYPHKVVMGSIKDKTVPTLSNKILEFEKEFSIGTIFKNKFGVTCEIYECTSSVDILVKYFNTNVCEKVSASSLRNGSWGLSEFKEKPPKNNYVYGAYLNNNLVYIGRGCNFRYKHCTSGKSSSVGLNNCYFKGDKIDVKIIIEGLNYDYSKMLEKYLINTIVPKFNELIPKKPNFTPPDLKMEDILHFN